jgi:hypothetical protein
MEPGVKLEPRVKGENLVGLGAQGAYIILNLMLV